MSRRVYICSECGKNSRWRKGWRHLLVTYSVWCSDGCEQRALARWGRGDYSPAKYETQAMVGLLPRGETA